MAAGAAPRARRSGRRVLDALLYSSGWVALAASALTAAAFRALGTEPRPAALLLAFAGTLVVYNVDRLRDLERDRGNAPRRTAFVDRHRSVLVGGVVTAALAAVAAAAWAGPAVMGLSAVVLSLGLVHRRIKHVPLAKALYLAGAWTAVVAGVPLVLADERSQAGRLLLAFFLPLLANAVGSSVRDAEAGAARFGTGPALRAARGIAAAGALPCLLPEPTLAALLPVPLLTLAALLAFRDGERFGLLVLDGALLGGALLALALL